MTRNVQISSGGIEPSHLTVECLVSLVLRDTGGLHYGGYYTLAIPPQASSQTLPHGRSGCQKSPITSTYVTNNPHRNPIDRDGSEVA